MIQTADLADADVMRLRALLCDPTALEALEESARAAFSARCAVLGQVARIGEPEPGPDDSEVRHYAMHLGEGLFLGSVSTLFWPGESRALLFAAESHFVAVPLPALSELALSAVGDMRLNVGAESVNAAAAIEGLCAFARDEHAWQFLDEPSASAVQAIAHNRPRPGHSVLGQGTFDDAEAAWRTLALGYARVSGGRELAFYKEAGFDLTDVTFMDDTSDEAIRQSGGTTAWLTFPDDFHATVQGG